MQRIKAVLRYWWELPFLCKHGVGVFHGILHIFFLFLSYLLSTFQTALNPMSISQFHLYITLIPSLVFIIFLLFSCLICLFWFMFIYFMFLTSTSPLLSLYLYICTAPSMFPSFKLTVYNFLVIYQFSLFLTFYWD